jgi:hypothetical protein
MDSELLSTFLALSRVLTGVDKLDPSLGRRYLDRLLATDHASALQGALERFGGMQGAGDVEAQVRTMLLSDAAMNAALVQLVLLWYTSAMVDDSAPSQPLRYGSSDEYFSGLGWGIIGAHVPALSGGYFGHWRYRPENEPKRGPDGKE